MLRRKCLLPGHHLHGPDSVCGINDHGGSARFLYGQLLVWPIADGSGGSSDKEEGAQDAEMMRVLVQLGPLTLVKSV